MQSTAAYTQESVTSQTAMSKGRLGSRPKTTKAGDCLVLAEQVEFKANSQRQEHIPIVLMSIKIALQNLLKTFMHSL